MQTNVTNSLGKNQICRVHLWPVLNKRSCRVGHIQVLGQILQGSVTKKRMGLKTNSYLFQ